MPTTLVEEDTHNFEDVRRRFDLSMDTTDLVPYENYIGAILGGQFRLGPIVRQDWDGDVYLVEPLDVPVQQFHAKAYVLSDLSRGEFAAKKRSMNKLGGQRICSIDQAGKKFIVYRAVHWRDSDGGRCQIQESDPQPVATNSQQHDIQAAPTMVQRIQYSQEKVYENETHTDCDHRKCVTHHGLSDKRPKHPNSTSATDQYKAVTSCSHATKIGTNRITSWPENVVLVPEGEAPKKKKKSKRNRGLKNNKLLAGRLPSYWEVEFSIHNTYLQLHDKRRSLDMLQTLLEWVYGRYKWVPDLDSFTSVMADPIFAKMQGVVRIQPFMTSNVKVLEALHKKMSKKVKHALVQMDILYSRVREFVEARGLGGDTGPWLAWNDLLEELKYCIDWHTRLGLSPALLPNSSTRSRLFMINFSVYLHNKV